MSFNFLHKLTLVLIIFISACQSDKTEQSESKPTPIQEKEAVAPANAKFQLLDGSQTGINFSNNISENHIINILTNSYMYNGGGVAILDVNNDGLQDVFFTSSQESNKLYLNKGDFKFDDVSDAYGIQGLGGFTTGVTAVDINQDGWMDLYVCRGGVLEKQEDIVGRRNLLFINQNGQKFTEESNKYGLGDMAASNHANFFDYDLDGDLDMYLLNHPIIFTEVNKISAQKTETGEIIRRNEPRDAFESDKLYKNNGDGTFTDVSVAVGIQNRAWGLSATVSDFNQDGYPDVFIGNDYIEPDYLYINNGNGTFSDKASEYFRHTSNHTMGVDIADYNNDGLVDLVALDMIAEDNRRQKELMTTMMTERYNSLVQYKYGHQMMRNTLQLNTGNGDFSEVGTIAGISNTDWSWACLMADFDNDSNKDLYITNGYRRDVSNLDYLNYTVDSVNTIGGFTKENFPDFGDYLKMIPSEKLLNYMYQNEGDLTFKKANQDWGIVQKSYSNGAAYGDLDNDGDLDLVINNITMPAFVYKNRTQEQDKNNYLQIVFEGSSNNKNGVGASAKIYTGDEIQYQELTPTRGFFSSVEHILHFGLGNKNTIDKIEIQWADGKTQILNNVNANQKLTVKYADAGNSKLAKNNIQAKYFNSNKKSGINFQHTENQFLDFNRERLLPHKLSNLGPSIAVADVNSDGLEDFYIGGATQQSGALFIQKKNSTFKKSSSETFAADANCEDLGTLFFDSDGDGDLDLYVVSGGNASSANSEIYQDRIYLNDGKGNFKKAQNVLRETTSGSCVTAFDYDKDGDQDLFVGGRVVPGFYPKAPRSFVFQNNGGKFSDVTAQVAPEFEKIGMVTDILWADLDGDKNEEMIVGGEWLPITVFKNEGGNLKVVQNNALQNSNGWWNCLHAADFDGDGDWDLVAGNEGRNTRLHATPQQPLTLFAADFDKNGATDPIMAYYNNDKMYPLPQLMGLLKQLPHLKKKYVRHRPYAIATMTDVFSNEELAGAQKEEAKTLATTYFQNDGKGNFTAKELPIAAQISVTNQILSEDVNNDGKLDLILAGNSYSPDVETGRYDAGNGVILLGGGSGNFDPISNQESGFWATKEVRDIAKIKLANGKYLILIANNNDVMEVVEVK